MQNVTETCLSPDTLKEAIKLARMAKEIVCPIPGGAGASVKIVKADYIHLLTQWLDGENDRSLDDLGHSGGVYSKITKVMSL